MKISFKPLCFRAKFKNEKPTQAFFEECQKQGINIENANLAQSIHGKEMLGKGKDKTVYPFLDNYVIAQLNSKKAFKPQYRIIPVEIETPDYNFSQPIAKTQDGSILFMEKIDGQSNGGGNWFSIRNKILKNEKLSNDDIKQYLSRLRVCADFPIDSYEDFALQIKYLSQMRLKIDFLNPDNLLVDYENEKFNLIDIISCEDRKIFDDFNGEIGCAQDMISLLVDSFLQVYYLNSMNEEDKDEAMKLTSVIIEKSLAAAKNVELCWDDESLMYYIEKIIELYPEGEITYYRKRGYEEFKGMYGL